MPKIRFTKDYVFKTSPEWIYYKAGEVHGGSLQFCEKYIRRGVAEYVPSETPLPETASPDPMDEPDVPAVVKRGRKPSA